MPQQKLGEWLKVIEAIQRRFEVATSKSELVRHNLPESKQESITYYERAINELKDATARIGQYSLQQIERQSEYLDKKSADLDARYQSRLAALESDFEQRQRSVMEATEKHAKRVAEFETRESKYVRRDLLARMIKQIESQKEIKLSPLTGKKRYVLHAVFLSSIALATAFVAVLTYHVTAGQASTVFLVPLGGGTLFTIATLIWYIRWNDQWFREHAQAEFRNMRFSADILRASWIAELLFEWHKETEKKEDHLPSDVITAFTNNLFREDKIIGTTHPAEELAKTLRGITKFNVSPTAGVTIEKARR